MLLEFLCCRFVLGNGASGVAGHWLVTPFHPFGRSEPAGAALDQRQAFSAMATADGLSA